MTDCGAINYTSCNDVWDDIIEAKVSHNGVFASIQNWSIRQQTTSVTARTQFQINNPDLYTVTATVTVKCIGLRAKP
jgi:hypothetical protein